jgi:hypothetical protein
VGAFILASFWEVNFPTLSFQNRERRGWGTPLHKIWVIDSHDWQG